MCNGINALNGVVECTRLVRHKNQSSGFRSDFNKRAYFDIVIDDDELKLAFIHIVLELLLQIGSFALASDSAANIVSSFEEVANKPNGNEAIRASDEDGRRC